MNMTVHSTLRKISVKSRDLASRTIGVRGPKIGPKSQGIHLRGLIMISKKTSKVLLPQICELECNNAVIFQ